MENGVGRMGCIDYPTILNDHGGIIALVLVEQADRLSIRMIEASYREMFLRLSDLYHVRLGHFECSATSTTPILHRQLTASRRRSPVPLSHKAIKTMSIACI